MYIFCDINRAPAHRRFINTVLVAMHETVGIVVTSLPMNLSDAQITPRLIYQVKKIYPGTLRLTTIYDDI